VKKYKAQAQVYIESTASKYIGEVEFDTPEEYNEKAAKLWEEQDYEYPTTNVSNNFDLGDWELNVAVNLILKYCENK